MYGVLGTRTWGGIMVGADKSTELWRHPICLPRLGWLLTLTQKRATPSRERERMMMVINRFTFKLKTAKYEKRNFYLQLETFFNPSCCSARSIASQNEGCILSPPLSRTLAANASDENSWLWVCHLIKQLSGDGTEEE